MNKTTELIKAIILLPITMLVLVPSLIIYLSRPFHLFCGLKFPEATFICGISLLLTSIGITFMLNTVFLFFTVGDGTPRPSEPPKHFVVAGPYGYVRNPMMLSALSILLGEVILFGSFPLLIYCFIFWVLNITYFIYVEESELAKRFGNDYLKYKKNVRRWIPRLKPWKPNNYP